MCRTNMNKILQPYWGYIKGELSKYSYKEKLKALKLSIQPSKNQLKKEQDFGRYSTKLY